VTTRPRIIWRRDPEFASAARAEHAFVEGYELVAFDIPPGKPGQKRIIGWEVWPPKTKALGSPDEYVRRIQELMGDNDAFDELIETLEADRSIKREEMRQIASGILGYDVPKTQPVRKSHRHSSPSVIEYNTLGGADAKACGPRSARPQERIKRELRRGEVGGGRNRCKVAR